jgi:hypothetical protein
MTEIAELTDRQIVELFCEDDKVVKVPGPEKPPSKEEERAQLFGFGAVVGIPLEELERTWRQKYPEG